MARVVAMYATAIAVPAVLLVGLWAALFASASEGPAAAGRTLFVVGALTVGLLWLNARLRRSLNPPLTLGGPRVCAHCGTPANPDEATCAVCGGTRFDSPPAAP